MRGDRPGLHLGRGHSPAPSWADTIIYEAHVKGISARHPDMPPRSAARSPGSPTPMSSITCSRLGVTAIELLPVHAFINERMLVNKGLTNYWGYNTLCFHAPATATSRSATASTNSS